MSEVFNYNYESSYSPKPSLDDGQIAFLGSVRFVYSWEINYWDGDSVTRVNHSSGVDQTPSLNNGQIAWSGYTGTAAGWEIFFWDGTSISNISADLSEVRLDNYNPSLYNGQIAWETNLDGDNDIYYWNGTSITKVTDNLANDINPLLYGSDIVWQSDVDGDYDIYYARLASEWIQDALPEVDLMDFTESEILELADMYSDGSSGTVHGMDWEYLSGNLPGDTDGEVYEIGDSWIYEGNYYIKLGSGLEGTSGTGAVPEVPLSSALVLLTSVFVIMRKKNILIFLQTK